ncbi:MAG: mechanosensitive ion channel family protein [Candidatus Cyclobacteriaceae bacterium M2_1C_046]
MNDILERVYYDNTVQQYLIALGIIVVGLLLIKLFKRSILTRIERLTTRTKTKIDSYTVGYFDKYGIPALYILVVYWGLNYLYLSERLQDILQVALIVSLTILGIRLVSAFVQAILRGYLRRQEGGEERVKQLSGLMLIINLIVWGLGLIFLFGNLGFDVTAVVAGLGIGGIAIALAAQNILGDLFNYFVILFDRPFIVGDFLIIDDKLGSVEKIGIKTTRIRSLSGEELIFSNGDLTSSRIKNYKSMQRRRIVFNFGVTYQTPLEKLKTIPGIIKTILEEQEQANLDRAHFAAYEDSSLRFEVVYFMEVPDYNSYMDTQQEINFRLYEELEKINVDIAYPTRTLYVNMENNSPKTALSPS